MSEVLEGSENEFYKKTFLTATLHEKNIHPAVPAAGFAFGSGRLEKPQNHSGETITIIYDWTNGPLAKAGDIEIAVLEYAGDEVAGKEIFLQHENGKLTGTLTGSSKAVLVFVCLRSDETWENNGGAGYFIPMYDATGMPLPESKAAQALMSRNYGGVFDLKVKADEVQQMFEQAFAQQPALRMNSAYFNTYCLSVSAAGKGSEASKQQVLAMLGEMENNPQADEKMLNAVANLYNRLAPDKSKVLKDKLLEKYPTGLQAQQARRQAISVEPDMAKREEMIEVYKRDFPPQNNADKDMIGRLYAGIADHYAKQKNWEKYKSVSSRMPAAARASEYNNLAWELAEQGEELQFARQLAAEAAEWAKTEMAIPSVPKPSTLTRKDWEKNREYTYAMYADTYAFVLDKTGDSKSAVKYQAEAVRINESADAEFNERYAGFLERAGSPELRSELEGFILKGAATAAMKEQFKKLYASEDKSEAGTAAYLENLEKTARENMRQEMMKKMFEEPAPAFALKNLNGENVSLDALRGKVVVVDFWATWCGPCKASFPGMQTAVDKYKNDPDVAFVFVNTWENGDNKEKTAGDFIKEKGYTFNVLMDNDNKVVSNFGVSGIPTKFIVDKNGKIRFKSVGYAGSSDALVDELSLMIDAAKGQP